MIGYYGAIVLLCIFALLALTILIRENRRFTPGIKQRFYQANFVIFLAIVAELVGLMLNGMPEWTRELHAAIKCMDYILTPIAGICFAYQVAEKSWRSKILRIILAFNMLLQVSSIFTGWTFYLDEYNTYHHGPLYFLYILIYLLVLGDVAIEFILYGRKFRKRNSSSLVAIITLIIVGICVQEVFGLRITYLSMVIASCMLFIHYSEFTQMVNDDHLRRQKKLLEIDTLTKIYGRYAYTLAIQRYANMDVLPDNLAIFSVDVNRLKQVNDSLGHQAGDELIRGAAACMNKVLSPYGKCYRTGGDEFVAIVLGGKSGVNRMQETLRAEVKAWKGELVDELSISIGVAISEECPGMRIDELIDIADKAMYREKKHFHEIMDNR